MTKVLFQLTDFSDPTDFGHGSIDPEYVLKIFSEHCHLNTRNACLQALKAGMGSTGFCNKVSFEKTYLLFESTIKNLVEARPNPRANFTAQQHQERWYRDAIETLVDAWFVVARRDLEDTNACVRPLESLFGFAKKEKVVFPRTKSLKHVLYYSWEWVGHEYDQHRTRSLHKLVGLQDFLFSYLHYFYLNLQEKGITDDNWEPIRKILEFMASRAYFKKKLMKEVSEIRDLLWELRAKAGGGDLKRMQEYCLYEQALSLCDFLIQVIRIKPQLQEG